MIRPNYADFRHSQFVVTPRVSPSSVVLQHSAEGSSWKKHKYVKKIDGVYYYPVGYDDGRTIDDLKGKEEKSDQKSELDMVKNHFDQYLAKRGIDWRTLPKDEIDQMQRDIAKRLEAGEDAGTEEKTADELAKDVIAGKFGNGEDRKKLLGDSYEEVQKIVNKLMKGSTGSKKIPSDKTAVINIAEEAAKKAVSLVNAYRNKKTK